MVTTRSQSHKGKKEEDDGLVEFPQAVSSKRRSTKSAPAEAPTHAEVKSTQSSIFHTDISKAVNTAGMAESELKVFNFRYLTLESVAALRNYE
jgi:hypothetical protein